MIKALRRYVWIHLVVIVLALAAFGDTAGAQGPKRSHHLRKLDGWLRATVDSRTDQRQRVIARGVGLPGADWCLSWAFGRGLCEGLGEHLGGCAWLSERWSRSRARMILLS